MACPLDSHLERQEKYRQILAERLEVIPTNEQVWKDFARRKARQQILGSPVPGLDLLIATGAACHGSTVATLNSADFLRVEGCAWEDWSG